MGNLARSGHAYGAAMRATGTPRSVEYQVFSQITGRLSQSIAAGTPFAALAEALHDNLTLWSAIAADVAGDGNALPQMLRGQLFHLAEFTTVHTRRVLKGEAGAEALIDVNQSIMRGLRAYPGETGGAPCPG